MVKSVKGSLRNSADISLTPFLFLPAVIFFPDITISGHIAQTRDKYASSSLGPQASRLPRSPFNYHNGTHKRVRRGLGRRDACGPSEEVHLYNRMLILKGTRLRVVIKNKTRRTQNTFD